MHVIVIKLLYINLRIHNVKSPLSVPFENGGRNAHVEDTCLSCFVTHIIPTLVPNGLS